MNSPLSSPSRRLFSTVWYSTFHSLLQVRAVCVMFELPTMTVLRSTAGAVAEAASQAGIRPPAVCVIGAVAGLGLT